MTSELRAQLDLPGLELDMSGLHASDTAGRTKSFKQFVEAGMHPEDAGEVTGVTLTRPTRDLQPSGPPTPGDDDD